MTDHDLIRVSNGTVSMRRPDARMRVLVFPHAGGSATSYLPLAKALPDWCEPHLFDLAGRGSRCDEEFAATFSAAVEGLRAPVITLLDRPAVLIGHSLGGLLAHSLVSVLPDPARAWVRVVVVSASRSPLDSARSARHPAAPFIARTREHLADMLRTWGGCPPEVFDDGELLDHAITILGHDLHLADTYTSPSTGAADVPHEVWYGNDDPHAGHTHARRWAAALAHPPRIRAFPGNHFYLGNRPEPVAALGELLTDLDRARESTVTDPPRSRRSHGEEPVRAG